MGIKGLWQVISPSLQTRPLTQLAILEGLDLNRRSSGFLRIGIDSSIWLNQAQSVFHIPGNNYQAGENPELGILFRRLCRLRTLPIIAIFVFDGEDRPDVKRNTNVSKKPHALTKSFKEFIGAFGFFSYTAPGEAEAELAALAKMGEIDAVMTDDSDAIVFGAPVVIRTPNVKRDGDNVHIYCATHLEEDPAINLSQAGLILFAVLSGGDYSPGLPHCGTAISYAIARDPKLSDKLLEIAKAISAPNNAIHAIHDLLANWKEDLRQYLLDDPHGFLGCRHSIIIDELDHMDYFPLPEILSLYANPITSWHPTASCSPPDMSTWLPCHPDIHSLTQICERSFVWGSEATIYAKFAESLWPSVITGSLAMPYNLNAALLAHANNVSTNDGPLPFGHILKIISDGYDMWYKLSGYKIEVQVDSLASLVAQSLRGLHEDGARLGSRPASPSKIRVWVPAITLRRAFPLVVDQYHQQKNSAKKKMKSEPLAPKYQPILSRKHVSFLSLFDRALAESQMTAEGSSSTAPIVVDDN